MFINKKLNKFEKAYFDIIKEQAEDQGATAPAPRNTEVSDKRYLIRLGIVDVTDFIKRDYKDYQEAVNAVKADIENIGKYCVKNRKDHFFSSYGGPGYIYSFEVPESALKDFLSTNIIGLSVGIVFLMTDTEYTANDIKEMPMEELVDLLEGYNEDAEGAEFDCFHSFTLSTGKSKQAGTSWFEDHYIDWDHLKEIYDEEDTDDEDEDEE